MTRPLTNTQRDTVSSMLEAKSPYQMIADTVHCHVSQIKRMARNKNGCQDIHKTVDFNACFEGLCKIVEKVVMRQ